MALVDSKVIESALNELTTQSDRAAAIIGAAIVDDVLTESLQLRLILSKAHQERLFSYEKNGPLASFSAKIDVAFSVGLIVARSRDEMHLIRRIRNRFAHRVEAIEFTDSKVAAFCRSLPIRDPQLKDPRRRYVLSCLTLVGMFGIVRQLRGLRLTHFINQREIADQMTEFEADLQEQLKKAESQRRET